MPPHEKLFSVEHLIPIQPDVTAKYWEKDEEIHPRNSGWYYKNKVHFCLTCVDISHTIPGHIDRCAVGHDKPHDPEIKTE